ncbi:MAG: hypothetical protein IKN63_01570 [Bacilli bacterium]|nr:hypothetical protein [Bacilli bacterium]
MERNYRDSIIYNDSRILELKKKIHKCIRNNEDFRILCFDIDDTLNRSKRATEEQIEKINFRASEKFLDIYRDSHPFFGDEDVEFKKNFFDLRNQILEEYGIYYESIDYNKIHTEEMLYPNVKEDFRNIAFNHSKNIFIILLSHYNPEREAMVKIQRYYDYMSLPNGDNLLDAIITLPVFMEKYEPNGKQRQITSKAAFLLKKLELRSKYIFNCILIDDSSSVRRDFINHGGIVIPAYLERGYIKELEDDPDDVNRVITSMDPIHFNHVLETIDKELETHKSTKNFRLKKSR